MMHSSKRQRGLQAGSSAVEVTIFLAVVAPVMIALSSTINIFSKTTTSCHHRTTTNGENHKVLQRIAAEVMQTSTRRDHLAFGNARTPEPEGSPWSTTNSAYFWVSGQGSHSIGQLHDTQARNGTEYWTPIQTTRRFYIYATYEPFDTLEFQRVKVDASMLQGGGVNQPWSAPRKIFLENGSVILRVLNGPSVILGTHVEKLRFHLNADGHIVVRLTTESGKQESTEGMTGGVTGGGTTYPGNGPSCGTASGSRLTSQVSIAPRNPLF